MRNDQYRQYSGVLLSTVPDQVVPLSLGCNNMLPEQEKLPNERGKKAPMTCFRLEQSALLASGFFLKKKKKKSLIVTGTYLEVNLANLGVLIRCSRQGRSYLGFSFCFERQTE